jgi:tetratricopeptide (TPR) repeat protein
VLDGVKRSTPGTVPGVPGDAPAVLALQRELSYSQEKLGHCHRKLEDAAAARIAYKNSLKRLRQLAESMAATTLDHVVLASFLATCPDATLRDPAQAVKIARAATTAMPLLGPAWDTLGVALYRAGDWTAAIAALEKSIELDPAQEKQNVTNRLFLAMCHWRLDHKDEARKWHARALKGMETLKAPTEELCRFRDEAAGLLGKP